METGGMRPTRAAIYARVSTTSKSRYGEALPFDQRAELQAEPLKRLAEQRGWTVTRVYCERINNAKERRPALDELLTDARRGRFDVLMVWRFDRLSRSVSHFLQIAEELHRLGIDFVSHEQSLDTTTAMGKFVLTMFAALAELERQTIRERVRAGIEYAQTHGTRSGKPIGRPKAIFDRHKVVELRSQGLSIREIARRLDIGDGTVRNTLRALSGASTLRKKPIAPILGDATDEPIPPAA